MLSLTCARNTVSGRLAFAPEVDHQHMSAHFWLGAVLNGIAAVVNAAHPEISVVVWSSREHIRGYYLMIEQNNGELVKITHIIE